MRTEEANLLKDKLESLSLNSFKAHLGESSVPSNKDSSKKKIRRIGSNSNTRII